MWQTILWQLLLFLAGLALKVGKAFVMKALEEADKANQLKHEDGSPYTGSEKYDVVYAALVAYAKDYKLELGDDEKSKINTIIELVVSYLKSKISK